MLKRRQLQKRARTLIAKYLSLCGLDMRCTRISVVAGLVVDGEDAWASIKNTGGRNFVITLTADLCSDRNIYRVAQVVGHEIAHLALSDCDLSRESEERLCDIIGDILKRSA